MIWKEGKSRAVERQTGSHEQAPGGAQPPLPGLGPLPGSLPLLSDLTGAPPNFKESTQAGGSWCREWGGLGCHWGRDTGGAQDVSVALTPAALGW